jgi:hypothetical protein
LDVVGAGNFTPVMVAEALAESRTRSGVSAESIDHCLIPEGTVGGLLDSLREAGLMSPEWMVMVARSSTTSRRPVPAVAGRCRSSSTTATARIS